MGALADRPFRRFFLAQTLSTFGDTAMYLAMAIWVKELTHSNAAAAAVIFAITAGALFAPLAGFVADRVPRLRLTIVVDLTTSGLVLALLGVRNREGVWIVYTVAVLYGLSLTILNAARSGLVRDLLPDALLGPGNASLQTMAQSMQLAAPLVGAGLFAAVGGRAVAVIDAATFVVAAALLSRVDGAETRARHEPETLARELSAGIAYVRRTPILRQLVLCELAVCSVLGFFEPLTFAVVDQGLHRRPTFVGVLVSVSGVGAVAAGLVAAAVLRRLAEPRTYAIAVLLFAVSAAAQIPHSLALVVVGSFAAGAGLTWSNIAIANARQRYSPRHLQGRVAAATNMTTIAQTLSIAVGAVLIDVIDYRVLLALMTAVFIAAAVPPLVRARTFDFDELTT
ncbi:MAG TPA: MFS transporter [Acidimicrobiia bacterium]|nr:MFS transporter [Acidimicrobiia bacterium]